MATKAALQGSFERMCHAFNLRIARKHGDTGGYLLHYDDVGVALGKYVGAGSGIDVIGGSHKPARMIELMNFASAVKRSKT